MGLQYTQARMYDPSTGRFLSEDPLGQYAGDVNVYRYVGNSPFAATDPSGQLAWFAPALFGAALGVGFNTLNNYSRGKKGWALLDGAGYAALGGAIGGASFVGMRGAGFSIAAAAAYSGFLSGGANEYADAVAEGRNPSAWGVIEKGLWGAIFGTVFGKLTPKQCPIRNAKPKEFPKTNVADNVRNSSSIRTPSDSMELLRNYATDLRNYLSSRKNVPGMNTKVRSQFRNGQGTVAVGELEVAGETFRIPGFSGMRNIEGFSPFISNPQRSIAATEVIGGRGNLYTRDVDPEAKILEQILKMTSENTSGTVRLFVDRVPCDSCTRVIKQFANLRPGIAIEIGLEDFSLFIPALQ